MEKTKVLIVGAGPTGLMMACQLRRMAIDCMIIDKKEGPTRESRALVLHARSLEIYDQLNIADTALQQGEVLRKIQFILKKRKIAAVVFGEIGKGLSKFPYLLVFEQSKNEELLYQYLRDAGGEVNWKTELDSLEQDNATVRAKLKLANGGVKIIEADWLVAADGSKSEVRHSLDMSFSGDTYEHIFYVADTKLKWPWGHDALSLYLSRNTFLGLFPMAGDNRFRVIGILPAAFQDEHPGSFEQIIPHIQSQVNVPLEFSETSWFSVYRLHHRCVAHFRNGRIFLCGDAAHIHSPAGGQGMNTGLQDAYNLAWKLAYVIKGQLHEKILDTYEQERLPFAKRLLASTDRAFTIGTSAKWWRRWIRLYMIPVIAPLAFRFRSIRRAAFRAVSQIAIRYTHSDLSSGAHTMKLKIGPGERFPYLLLNDGSCLYDKMKEPVFYLLVFSGKGSTDLSTPGNEFAGMMKVLQIASDEKTIFNNLGIEKEALILVRPDHYVALVTGADSVAVKNYFLSLKS